MRWRRSPHTRWRSSRTEDALSCWFILRGPGSRFRTLHEPCQPSRRVRDRSDRERGDARLHDARTSRGAPEVTAARRVAWGLEHEGKSPRDLDLRTRDTIDHGAPPRPNFPRNHIFRGQSRIAPTRCASARSGRFHRTRSASSLLVMPDDEGVFPGPRLRGRCLSRCCRVLLLGGRTRSIERWRRRRGPRRRHAPERARRLERPERSPRRGHARSVRGSSSRRGAAQPRVRARPAGQRDEGALRQPFDHVGPGAPGRPRPRRSRTGPTRRRTAAAVTPPSRCSGTRARSSCARSPRSTRARSSSLRRPASRCTSPASS